MIKYQLPGYGETDTLLISTTAAWTGLASSITIEADTVFAVLTGTVKLHGASALADFTFLAGRIMRGIFTAITLTSGKVSVGLMKAGDTISVQSASEPDVQLLKAQ